MLSVRYITFRNAGREDYNFNHCSSGYPSCILQRKIFCKMMIELKVKKWYFQKSISCFQCVHSQISIVLKSHPSKHTTLFCCLSEVHNVQKGLSRRLNNVLCYNRANSKLHQSHLSQAILSLKTRQRTEVEPVIINTLILQHQFKKKMFQQNLS